MKCLRLEKSDEDCKNKLIPKSVSQKMTKRSQLEIGNKKYANKEHLQEWNLVS